MRITILLLTLFLSSKLAFSQNISINIQIVDTEQKPLIGTTVKLINRNDSTKILNAIADTAGLVKFVVMSAQYIVRMSSIGYKNLEKGINISPKQTNFKFSMETDASVLSGVSVVAQRPLMRQEDDKTIVDPEPLANSSTSGYEVLEKTPGLFLDQDGNIYISSSTPATIFINGRQQKMSANDIASMLKSLPPNSIEKIEIMRTPSAKYDASGAGGVVNVVLKKGVKIGLTGSVNLGMNQGRLGNQFGGFNINNNDGTKTSYFNLNITNRNSYDQVETIRNFSLDSVLSQESYSTTPSKIIYTGYGLSFELNKKWELNIDGRGSYGNSQNSSENENFIKKLSNNELFSDNLNNVTNNAKTFSFNQGLSTKYKIDSIGSEITSDFSYNYFSNNTSQNYNTQFLKPLRQAIIGNGDIQSDRQNFAGQIDLVYKFPHKLSVEAGVKTSSLIFKNATNFYQLIADKLSTDKFRTNTFDYNENINAAYLQASKGIKEFILKIGTRVENTNMNGHQRIPKDTTFKIKRTDFFPYVYLSRKVAKIAGYELRSYLVYRRSITRPVYEYLNPFPKFIDQYLYETGNPTLRPQFTQNYEANVSVQGMPIFAYGRNYTQDIFTNVVYQDPRNPSVSVRTYDNLGKNQESYFRLIGAIPPGKKYFFVIVTQYSRNKYEGLYENRPLNFDRGSWRFFTQHQLKLDKLSSVTSTGQLLLKGQQQFYELSSFGNLNLTVNRQFMKQKLMATLSINDIFFTNNNRFVLNQGNISANGFRKSDTRRVGFNLRYNFGIRKKEERTNMFNIDNLENAGK